MGPGQQRPRRHHLPTESAIDEATRTEAPPEDTMLRKNPPTACQTILRADPPVPGRQGARQPASASVDCHLYRSADHAYAWASKALPPPYLARQGLVTVLDAPGSGGDANIRQYDNAWLSSGCLTQDSQVTLLYRQTRQASPPRNKPASHHGQGPWRQRSLLLSWACLWLILLGNMRPHDQWWPAVRADN